MQGSVRDGYTSTNLFLNHPVQQKRKYDVDQHNNNYCKEYIKSMTLEDARVNYKIRSQMLEVKYNYSHDPRFTKDLCKCDSCESAIDTQSHILWCPSYSELRAGKDINNNEDLINYIKNVMKTRQKLHITK